MWYQALKFPAVVWTSEHLAAVIRWTGAADPSSFFHHGGFGGTRGEEAENWGRRGGHGVTRFSRGNWVGRMPWIMGYPTGENDRKITYDNKL